MGASPRVRCHSRDGEWFHATEPSVAEVAEMANEPDVGKYIVLVDRHVILSQSSFECESAALIPWHLFPWISEAIVSAGVPSKPDGSCHAAVDK